MIHNIIILELKKIIKRKSIAIMAMLGLFLPLLYYHKIPLDRGLNFFQFILQSTEFVFDILVIYLSIYLCSLTFSYEWEQKIEIMLLRPLKDKAIFWGKTLTINIIINLVIFIALVISLVLGLLSFPWEMTIDKYLIGNLEVLYRLFLAIFIIILNIQLIISYSILIGVIAEKIYSSFILGLGGFTFFSLLENVDFFVRIVPTATIRNWRGAPLVLDIPWNIFNFNLWINTIYIIVFYTLAYFLFLRKVRNREA